MKKILFVIHDLGEGGAEKVLINLVNNMDHTRLAVTVMALFGGGVNEQFLSDKVKLINCFSKSIPGNSHLMKLLSPKRLHTWLIKDRYDVEVAYLEGPSARIVSGCTDDTTKLVSWVHCTMGTKADIANGFRSYEEAVQCYQKMDAMVFVSNDTRSAFLKQCPYNGNAQVLYNTNNSERIVALSEELPTTQMAHTGVSFIGVGKLTHNKGFDRMLRSVKRLRDEGYALHLYILGMGPLEQELKAYIQEQSLEAYATLLGYQTNPYQYIRRCDVYLCASHSEGFSTAATESLILGVPVCTVAVSGMKEMLGENNEYGIVVDNDDEALYQGMKRLLDDSQLLAHYKQQAALRGRDFSTEQSVKAVQDMLLEL